MTGCDGFPLNYPMCAHTRDSPTDPSYPSRLLKRKDKTRHFIPVTLVTNPPLGNRVRRQTGECKDMVESNEVLKARVEADRRSLAVCDEIESLIAIAREQHPDAPIIELAPYLPEPQRSVLLELLDGLREIVPFPAEREKRVMKPKTQVRIMWPDGPSRRWSSVSDGEHRVPAAWRICRQLCVSTMQRLSRRRVSRRRQVDMRWLQGVAIAARDGQL